MIFPENIVGPKFDEGDLVTFVFDGAELTLRVPIISENRDHIDEVSSLSDFQNVDTRSWRTDDLENPLIQLVLQHWNLEHSKTLDDIAQCRLYVELVEVTEKQQSENILLEPSCFEDLILSWISYFFKNHEEKYAEDPSWPAPANRYHGRSINKEHLNWFLIQLALNSRSKPSQLVMIPINNRFVLTAYIKIESLHYAGRANPFSDEALKKFEWDLFNDFLSHIKIEYSPELIATIESLKDKAPA